MPRTTSPAPQVSSHEPEKDANDTSITPDSLDEEEEKEVLPTITSPEPPRDPLTPPSTKQKQKQKFRSTNPTTTKEPKSKSKKPSNTPLDLQVLAAMGDQTAKAKLEKQRRPKYRKLAKTEEGRRDLVAWRSLGDGVAKEVLEGVEMKGRRKGRKKNGKEENEEMVVGCGGGDGEKG